MGTMGEVSKMINYPPCRECEHRHLPKQGAWISADGTDLRTPSKYLKERNLKPNPCFTCTLPGQYADYIESIFLCAPTRPSEAQTVGSNILDRALRDIP